MNLQTAFFLLSTSFCLHVNAQKDYIQRETDSINKHPNDSKRYYTRGFSYYSMDENYALAIADFSSAIRLNPKYFDAYKWRGISYGDLKQYDLAVKDYSAALAIKPKDLVLYLFRGHARSSLKKYQLAVDDYTTVIKMAKSSDEQRNMETELEAHAFRGYAYADLKLDELAVKDFTWCIEHASGDGLSYLGRATSYYNLKQFDLAIADLRTTLEIIPGYPEAEEKLEIALRTQQRVGKNLYGGLSFQIESGNDYVGATVAKGDKITIAAEGSISFGGWAGSGGPEGIDGFTIYNRISGFRHGSLLVRIGDEGDWYAVGKLLQLTAPVADALQFMVNDNDPSNNSGSFTVKILVKKK